MKATEAETLYILSHHHHHRRRHHHHHDDHDDDDHHHLGHIPPINSPTRDRRRYRRNHAGRSHVTPAPITHNSITCIYSHSNIIPFRPYIHLFNCASIIGHSL